MTSLYMVELRPDLTALVRFLRDQGLDTGGGDEDLGYGLHAWLTAAFGDLSPKPWRLLLDRRRPPRILGYSQSKAEELRQRLHDFADPGVFAVCQDPNMSIASKPMPAWSSGRRLGFELQCCPVGREARTGVEKDLFLIHADAAGSANLRREDVYCDWVRERLEEDEAALVTAIGLTGFRLVRQTRQTWNAGERRQRSRLVRPQALVRGELTVKDTTRFADLVGRGIGRHRSFGYGMLLLRPPA